MAAEPVMTSAPHPDWSTKTYLVIDDFSIAHRMMRDMLRKLGALAIDTVKNGADAIALLKEKQYDVVLCDYNFSEGPNGQQILEEAKHRDLIGLACIWIMVSSEKAMEIVMGAAELAPDGYILKPLTESLLLARLNRAWDKKQAFTAIDRAYADKDYAEAIQLCDQQLAGNRLHAMELLRIKAGLLLKGGELQQARRVFEQVLALREQVWAKAGLARIHFLEGQYREAKKLLLEIVRANPAFLDGYDQLAQTLQHLGETSQALRVLEKAAQLSPYSVRRQKNLGEVAMKLGEFEVAEHAFRMSIEVGEYSVLKTPEAYLGLARVYGLKKQPEDALQTLGAVRQVFEGEQIDLRARIVESQVYADNGMTDKAQRTADEIRRHLAATNISLGTETSLEMAQLLSATGDVDASKEIIRTIQAQTLASAETSVLAVDNVDPDFSSESHQDALAGQTASSSENANLLPAGQLSGDVQSLYQRALTLIQYMKRNGYNSVSGQEIRAVLERAEKIAPGNMRSRQILAMLHALAAGRRG